ncbi:MAG: nucleotidyltransferase family protein [Candidatus Woesearchaeota archaeon]
MKDRVTFTIERDILRQVDNTIDGSTVKNRSHAVELLLIKALGQNRPRKALILAGGSASRLKQLSPDLPKPLVPVQGKPILEYNIEMLKKFDIKDIIVSIGMNGEKIKDYLGDGSKLGVKITYVEETNPLGTAGPLRLARPYLTETFIMMNGDELKDIDLIDMYEFHKGQRAQCTIALTTGESAADYGVAMLHGNKILSFVEKPSKKNAPSNLINAGCYIMEPSVIDLAPKGFGMLEQDIFPKLAKENKLYGYVFSGQWFDTNTVERYERAIKEWRAS